MESECGLYTPKIIKGALFICNSTELISMAELAKEILDNGLGFILSFTKTDTTRPRTLPDCMMSLVTRDIVGIIHLEPGFSEINQIWKIRHSRKKHQEKNLHFC